MLRRRIHRLSTTVCVVLSLLFSQLALASYVCLQQADAGAMAAAMEGGQPCDSMDPTQPVLCHQHWADPAKTVDAVKLPLAAQPALVQVLERPGVSEADADRAVPPTASSQAQPPPDPLFLSTLRLRV